MKRLRRFPVPESALEAGRKKLLEFMKETPMVPLGPRQVWRLRWRPLAVTLCVAVFVTSGTGIVAAAQGALPGDRLYGVKRASEEMQEYLALTPARKFSVQAARASRRLKEAERLIARHGAVTENLAGRVQAAMDSYEDHLFEMNALAVELAVEPPKLKVKKRAYRAAEEVFDRHAELMVSASLAQPGMAESVLEPVELALELESEVEDAFAFEEETEASARDREERRLRRAERIQTHLEELRTEIQSEKTLEDSLNL